MNKYWTIVYFSLVALLVAGYLFFCYIRSNPRYERNYIIEVKRQNGFLDTIHYTLKTYTNYKLSFQIENSIHGLFLNSGTIPYLVIIERGNGWQENVAFDVINFKVLSQSIKSLQ